MNEMSRTFAKLQAIERLWAELERTKVNDPEYEMLIEKIRVQSAEYQALVDAPQKPEKPK
jgi:hypothetical protein